MSIIRPLDPKTELPGLLECIRHSFATVAQELNLTKESASTNPAFLSLERLESSISEGLEFFVLEEKGHIQGCVALQKGREEGSYYLERLAVLPEYRHRGYGRALLDHCMDKVRERGGRTISIAIIDENIRLKKWYKDYGFIRGATKKFDHLPFTVLFMEKKLQENTCL